MGLLSRLLGNREHRQQESAGPAERAQPGQAAPAYEAGLITRLAGDHRELLRTFDAIQRAAAESRFHDTQHLLPHFKHTFQLHLATENARLFAYLQQRVAHNAEAARRLAALHRELNDHAFMVLKVVDAYLAYPPTHLNEAQFNHDLEEAAAALAQRVDMAASRLYPLYRP